MTKTEAIAKIQSMLPKLTSEQVQELAELATALVRPDVAETDETRAAIGQGLAEAERQEFASEDEVEAAFDQFRK